MQPRRSSMVVICSRSSLRVGALFCILLTSVLVYFLISSTTR